MGREIRRVLLDFDHPLNVVWPGYIMPDDLLLPMCPECGGSGLSDRTQHLFDIWYGERPFQPEDNGSIPHTANNTAILKLAIQNISRRNNATISDLKEEMHRIAELCNQAWCYHLNQDDVDALLANGRLGDHTRESGTKPCPQDVNNWAISTIGHDAINAGIIIRARCQRDGIPYWCDSCTGTGNAATPEQREAYDNWEPSDPPTGEGWQLWETTTEGSPLSPVFPTGEELAEWMSQNPCGFAGGMIPLETALSWVRGIGWSPSLISDHRGVQDGITAMADSAEEMS